MQAKDENRCKAKSKRSGKQCKNRPMKGKTVCRMHGGKTPTGFASPNLKTGKHSKYLRLKGISDDIERHRTAEDILTQNEEIAHTRVLLEKTLYRLLSGSDIPSYKELGRIVVKMKLHARNGNQAQFTTAFGELSTMVELGAGIQSDMIEYLNLSDHLRKQIESQRKQAIENKEMVKITQTQKLLEIFITTATESLRTHVSDPKARQAILTDIANHYTNTFGGISA